MVYSTESASAGDADPGTRFKEEKKRSRPFDFIIQYLLKQCLTFNLRLPYDFDIIICWGKILACDSPRILKKRLMQSAIDNLTLNACDEADFDMLKQLPGVRQAAIDRHLENPELEIILDQDDVLARLIAFLTEKGAHLLNLHKREATLEDVFVDLVGSSMKEVENAG